MARPCAPMTFDDLAATRVLPAACPAEDGQGADGKGK